MPNLFGRPAEGPFLDLANDLEQVIKEDANTAAVAQAWNLQNDHRVTDARAQKFLEIWREQRRIRSDTPHLAISNTLRITLKDFVQPNPEDTLLHTSNGENILPEEEGDSTYATVVSAGAVAAFAIDHSVPIDPADQRLFSFDGLRPRRTTFAELISKLGPTPEQCEEHYVRRLLSLRDRCLTKVGVPPRAPAPKNPCWAARWQDFAASADPGTPATWKHSVGLFVRSPGECVVLFKYELPKGLRAVRPTVLESGGFGYHYPSPRNWPPSEGGCCLQAGLLTRSNPPLVHEFIHHEFPFTLDHWKNAKASFGNHAGPVWIPRLGVTAGPSITPGPPSNEPWDLKQARGFHERRLSQNP